MTDRVPQLKDEVILKLRLPAPTEEWADELLEEYGARREADGSLVVEETIGGNCNAIVCAAGFLSDIAELLAECEVDPMAFEFSATSRPERAREAGASR